MSIARKVVLALLCVFIVPTAVADNTKDVNVVNKPRVRAKIINQEPIPVAGTVEVSGPLEANVTGPIDVSGSFVTVDNIAPIPVIVQPTPREYFIAKKSALIPAGARCGTITFPRPGDSIVVIQSVGVRGWHRSTDSRPSEHTIYVPIGANTGCSVPLNLPAGPVDLNGVTYEYRSIEQVHLVAALDNPPQITVTYCRSGPTDTDESFFSTITGYKLPARYATVYGTSCDIGGLSGQ